MVKDKEKEKEKELKNVKLGNVAAGTGKSVIYGLEVPPGSSRLALELFCYRTKRMPKDGGLGPLAHFKNAWTIMWPNFDWNEWSQLLVEAWCKYDLITVIGHAAASKTFTLAHIALLDYVADPFNTMTSLTTVTFDGLRLRMWGDLMRAYETRSMKDVDSFKVFSSSNRMNLFADAPGHAHEKYMIEGMATSKTKDADGRIRGKHAPRRRVILDEAEDMADAIFDTFANIRSDPDAKIVMMTNPKEKLSRFGQYCKPVGGWETIHDTDLIWETEKGGVCVHFDALQNPNFKAGLIDGKKKYQYMMGPTEVDVILKAEGEGSVKWWEQVRGYFAPDGLVSKVFPSAVLEWARAPIKFDFEPERIASLDPAFEHDDCVLQIAEKGKLRDGRIAVNCVKTIKIISKEGPGLLPKDYQVAEEVIKICKHYKVKPSNFIMDKTGNGRGVLAILQKEWGIDCEGIMYAGAATDRPLRYGESDPANRVVKSFVSELWFRARYLAESRLLGGLDNLDPKTMEDLSVRRYESKKHTHGSLMEVESKDLIKKRLGRSPDYGDSFVQLAELMARQLSMTGKKEELYHVSDRWDKYRMFAKKASKRFEETSVNNFW